MALRLDTTRFANAIHAYYAFTCVFIALTYSATVYSQEARTDSDVVEMVVSAFEDNYAQLGFIKAQLENRTVSTFTFDGVSEPTGDKSQSTLKPNAPVGGRKAGTPRIVSVRWLAHLGPNGHRFDVSTDAGREIISVDRDGITSHRPDLKRAVIRHLSPGDVTSQPQYDPREAGFISLGERLVDLLRLSTIESAQLIKRPSGETIAELRLERNERGQRVVVECSSQFSFLPVRVYYLLDDDSIAVLADLTYEKLNTALGSCWFLETATQRVQFPHRNTTLDAKQWGQVSTTTVLSVTEDAEAPPPRQTAATLPEDTRVDDQTALARIGTSQIGTMAFYIAVGLFVVLFILGLVLMKRRANQM
jgi:hypothetical protein